MILQVRYRPEGPCTHTVYTLALKWSLYRDYFKPKYILYEHMDPCVRLPEQFSKHGGLYAQSLNELQPNPKPPPKGAPGLTWDCTAALSLLSFLTVPDALLTRNTYKHVYLPNYTSLHIQVYTHILTYMHTHTYIQRDRETDRQTGRQPARQPGRQPGSQPASQAGRQAGSQAARQPGSQPARQPGSQAVRQTGS